MLRADVKGRLVRPLPPHHLDKSGIKRQHIQQSDAINSGLGPPQKQSIQAHDSRRLSSTTSHGCADTLTGVVW